MADENTFEIDMIIYEGWCVKHGVEYLESDAEHFALSVANRVIDGGQEENVARAEQFTDQTGVTI